MRIEWRPVHILKEQVANIREWETQSRRELGEWTEDTHGATLPAVEAFSEAFGTFRRELKVAAEGCRSAGAPGNGHRSAGRCAREQGLYRGLQHGSERPVSSDSSMTSTVTVTVR